MKGKLATFIGVLLCMFATGNQDAVSLFPFICFWKVLLHQFPLYLFSWSSLLFSHHFLRYVISYKSWCCLSFRFLLCAIFIFLSPVVELCLWDNWPCPISFRSSLLAIFLLFSVEELCLWDTWPCPVSFLSSLLAISLLSSVVEFFLWDTWPCAVSFPSSLCDIFMLFSVEEPCLWDTWPCAVSFPSSLLIISLLSSVVEFFLWDTWPCAVSFPSSLCDIFMLFSVEEPCLLDLCCFSSIFSVQYFCVVFGFWSLPVG